MLTTKLLSYYQHLIATTVICLTVVDPLQELADTFGSQVSREQQNARHRMPPLALASAAASDQDYYDILGVKKDATKPEIHRAFRQLAKKYHPDKNKDKGAQEEFIKIFKAFETLSDEKKRKEYDALRDSGYRSGWNTGSNSGSSSFGFEDFDMNDFFRQYEDQFAKHAQHFHEHHEAHSHAHHSHPHEHNHEQFLFHGVNLDFLFHDDDSFDPARRIFEAGNANPGQFLEDYHGLFGDGESFFGSHFASHMNHHHHGGGGGSHNGHPHGGGHSCQTITKQVNGMVMTQTSCS